MQHNTVHNLQVSSKKTYSYKSIHKWKRFLRFAVNHFALWIVKFSCIVSWSSSAYQEILVMAVKVSCHLRKPKITKPSWHLTGLPFARRELHKCKKLKGWLLYFFILTSLDINLPTLFPTKELCVGGCQKCFLSALNWLLLMPMNLDIYLSSRLCPVLSMFENCFCKLLVTGKNVFLKLSPSLVKYCLKIDPTAGWMCLLLRYGLPDFHVEYFRPKRMTCTVQVLHGRLTPTVWNFSSVYFLK